MLFNLSNINEKIAAQGFEPIPDGWEVRALPRRYAAPPFEGLH